MPGRRLPRPTRDALLAVATVAGLTVLGTAVVEHSGDRQAARAAFHAHATQVVLSLVTTLNQEMQSVEQLTAFLDATRGQIDGAQFRTIAKEIRRANPDLVAVEWVERVPAAGLAAHQAEAGRNEPYQVSERQADGSLGPVAGRVDYFPIRYSEPDSAVDRVIGFDLGSDSIRRAVLTRSAATGEIAASGAIRLIPSGTVGAIIAHPVFSPPNRSPIGFAVEVLRFESLVGRAAGVDSGARLRVAIESGSGPTATTHGTPSLVHEASLPVGGTSWAVTITPSGDAYPIDPRLSATGWFALIFGLATSLGAGVFVFWQVRSRATIAAARSELQRANTELEAAFDALPDLYFRLDPEGRFLGFRQGRSGPALFRPPSEFVDRLMDEVLPPEVVTLAREAMARIRETGQPAAIEYSLPIEGVAHWYETRLFAGTDGEFLLFVRDVTDRREREMELASSEERFRELAESADGVFWLADVATRDVPYLSSRFEVVFGLPLVEPSRRLEAWAAAIHPDDRDRVVRAMAACLNGVTDEFDLDYRIRRSDGTIRWINDRARRISMTEGTRLLGFARDVTDRRLAEESRAALETQLRNLQKMEAIGTLAGGIAHDFNNILGAILGYASLLELQLDGQERARSDLSQILTASGRAKALVQQILTFSQQREQARSPIRLQSIVKEALALLRAGLPSTVTIESRIEGAPGEVMADGTQVHQVVINLVTNAADAIGVAPGTILVHYHRVTVTTPIATVLGDVTPGDYACLTVRDDGPGMTPDTIERIFEPFFTTKAPGKGTGLGLAVVHGIVRAHDGAIEVVSAPGSGTTIRVYLPLTALPPAVEPGGVTFEEARGAGQNVLIVDDEAPLAMFCRKVLEGNGYRAAAYVQPEAALAAFQREPADVDLALLDLTMPQMTGVTLARRLHAIRPDLPVILMTGYASTLTDATVQELGVDRLLLKPLDLKTLVTAVADVLAAGKAG